ncbi:hypothetical protein CsSME_00032676 [Camellia sinensis var. sinensis]
MVKRSLGLLQVPGVILDYFARKLDNLEGSKDTSSIDTSFIFLVTTKDSTARPIDLSNCDFYLDLRPESCPDFNKGE